VAKAAMRINRTAANESHPIPKALAPHARDLVQGRNPVAVQEAVHVQLLVRDLHHDRVLDLDLLQDPGQGAFQNQEVGRYPGQDQGQPKADQDRGQVRTRVARGQGLTVAREEVDQNQDQDRVQERVVQGHQVVQEKAYRRQDPKVARVQARRNVSQEARVDRGLNRNLFQGLNQDRGVVAGRDRALDRRAVLEAGVRADRHGKLIFLHTTIINI